MIERCPAIMVPPHAFAAPIRCTKEQGDHALHYSVDREPPRTARRWLDSMSCARVGGQGERMHA